MNRFGIAGLAAAASLSVVAMAAPALAADTFTLVSSTMDTEYTAYISGFGEAYDGPLTFTVAGYPGTTGDTTLFGFCFDIYHDMYLGNLGYTYTTNQFSTDGGLDPNSPQTLDSAQVTEITNLVDTGWLMQKDGGYDNLAAREAAIQAAIWDIEDPGVVSNLQGGNATDTALVNKYYLDYSTGNYQTLAAPQDKVFTISDGTHQSFAIGWPVGVPEPATWAMMLTGFFGMGSILRRRRKAALAA